MPDAKDQDPKNEQEQVVSSYDEDKLSTKKKKKRKKRLIKALFIFIGWFGIAKILSLLFEKGEKESIEVSIWAERVELFGLDLSMTVVVTWILMVIISVLAVLFRIFVVPKMSEKPKGLQNIIEIIIENISKYTDSTAGKLGDNLGAYIFAVAVFMVSCAAVELFGVRAPTADITLTFSMAFITFVLINYYGIKKKGIKGRFKSLMSPTPIILPIIIITNLAVPVSLACRLFGNMLGGLVVMDLLYVALGSYAVGIPSVLGLYFNVFHPLIQTFIFVTLSLTFINEAVE